MELDNLVTDRTQADVNRLVELTSKVNRGTATEAEFYEYLYGGTERLEDINGESLEDLGGELLEAYVGVQKGAYNASDLNRVGAAMLYCQTILAGIGIPVELDSVKTDWAESDMPTVSDMDLYLDNLSALKTAINSPVYFPAVPESMNNLTWATANDIERILQMLEIEVENIKAAYVICGQSNLYCGGFALPIGG